MNGTSSQKTERHHQQTRAEVVDAAVAVQVRPKRKKRSATPSVPRACISDQFSDLDTATSTWTVTTCERFQTQARPLHSTSGGSICASPSKEWARASGPAQLSRGTPRADPRASLVEQLHDKLLLRRREPAARLQRERLHADLLHLRLRRGDARTHHAPRTADL